MEQICTTLQFEDRNKFIEDHLSFILKTITKITKRYVSLENDEEFSIALLAFNEAIDKYNSSRGPFLPFAQLVIMSRLKTFLQNKNKFSSTESIEKLKDEGIDITSLIDNPLEDSSILKDEISILKKIITTFGFEFEDLIDESPKHKKTKDNAISISKRVSEDISLTTFMYEKKRLPIKQISLKCNVTEKVIKGSKKFIITVTIIFHKNFRNLKLWIRR